jgi:LysR family glycine cleavage system transcriptional activator
MLRDLLTHATNQRSDVKMVHTSARPSLDAIETVLTAAETGSFSAAAEKLGMTHGAISRRVSAVEAWSKIRLFERHGRGVRVTVDGNALLDQLEDAIARIDGSIARASAKLDVDILRISVVPSFARLFILPNLHRLEGSPRDVRIELEIDQKITRPSLTRIAVRHGMGHWSGVSATALFRESLLPIASEVIARRIGRDADPSKLLDYPLLLDMPDKTWKAWFAANQINYHPRRIDRQFADYDLTLQAASVGLGIALLRSPFGLEVADRLRVRPVSSIQVASPTAFYAVSQLGQRTPTIDRLIARMTAILK